MKLFFDQGAIEFYSYLIDIVIPYTTIYIALGSYVVFTVWKHR